MQVERTSRITFNIPRQTVKCRINSLVLCNALDDFIVRLRCGVSPRSRSRRDDISQWIVAFTFYILSDNPSSTHSSLEDLTFFIHSTRNLWQASSKNFFCSFTIHMYVKIIENYSDEHMSEPKKTQRKSMKIFSQLEDPPNESVLRINIILCVFF
jgi:hypothetical protein